MSTPTLSLLANQLDVPLSCEDVALTGLAIDSRQVKPGDLFAAIEGATVNGNDFIDAAIANGAAAVISKQSVAQPIPSLQVESVEKACADFGLLMRNDTSGKSSWYYRKCWKDHCKSLCRTNMCASGRTQ